jgi:hypothetical protein
LQNTKLCKTNFVTCTEVHVLVSWCSLCPFYCCKNYADFVHTNLHDWFSVIT